MGRHTPCVVRPPRMVVYEVVVGVGDPEGGRGVVSLVRLGRVGGRGDLHVH